MKEKIGITGWGGVSALGSDRTEIWEAYRKPNAHLQLADENTYWQGRLSAEINDQLVKIRQEDKNLGKVDKSVILAILSAKKACEMAEWSEKENFGINIGSSRGATAIWEKAHQQFLQAESSHLPTLTSPLTTLGNISSWVSYSLQQNGPVISHSVTCSTAAHALLNGLNWIESGRCRRFLVGGSEAPLTDFTVGQMRALRIYADHQKNRYPCRALDLGKSSNSIVLGEGAACFCLEANPLSAFAYIKGIGFSNERIQTATSLSRNGECIQKAMKMALEEAGTPPIDVVVCHTPGTKSGDKAEVEAIKQVFEKNIPLLTTNKWKIGHTLGASGALSLEFAILMLINNEFIPVPYVETSTNKKAQPIQYIMINALGFGGNAVSIILSKN